MRFGLHSLRSALNAMQLPYSASFQLVAPLQMRSALLKAQAFGRNGAYSLLRFASFVQGNSRSSFHASPGASRALSEAVRGQSVGAAVGGSSFLRLRALTALVVAKSGFPSFSSNRPCQRVLPNPSIERTSNGGPRLLAFAKAVPPLLASHLKR
jgi:hypothetical protein